VFFHPITMIVSDAIKYCAVNVTFGLLPGVRRLARPPRHAQALVVVSKVGKPN
jgi:hypothetical protein